MRYLRGGWSAPTMTALKYPNKKKRKGYWKIYDRARIKDFRKIWDFSLEIVKKSGNPFPKKDKRGIYHRLHKNNYNKICKSYAQRTGNNRASLLKAPSYHNIFCNCWNIEYRELICYSWRRS